MDFLSFFLAVAAVGAKSVNFKAVKVKFYTFHGNGTESHSSVQTVDGGVGPELSS